MISKVLRRSAAEALRTRSLKAFPCTHQRITGTVTPATSSLSTRSHQFVEARSKGAPERLQRIRLFATMAPPKLETVSVAIEDRVATLKYNRPSNANALSPQVMKDLGDAFRYINAEPSVRVVVYTGEGKFFTAGLDLQAVPKDGPVISDEGVEYLRLAMGYETMSKVSRLIRDKQADTHGVHQLAQSHYRGRQWPCCGIWQ